MNFKQTLDSKIADHNLLDHPFYQAWSTGELPLEALRSYAREYGVFHLYYTAGMGNDR